MGQAVQVTVKDVSSMPELTKQEENPEIITADYVDTEGNKLADTVFSDKKAEKKNFPGYTFEKEEKTLTGFKCIYRKDIKPCPCPEHSRNLSRRHQQNVR